MKRKLWIVSEFYHPDENATGYLMTVLAEGLAKDAEVHAVCGLSCSTERSSTVNLRGERNGVQIRRCLSTCLDKNNLLFRLVNVLTMSLSAGLVLLMNVKSSETLLVVTNPPLLPFIAALVARWKRADCIIVVHDVYPEALVGTNVLSPRSMTVRLLDWMHRRLYRQVRSIVVLGRDMFDLVSRKVGTEGARVTIIPNAADTEMIVPVAREQNELLRRLNIRDGFVVAYVGNMGRSHDIENLFACARRINADERTHFLFIGEGVKKRWLEDNIRRHELRHASVLPYPSRLDQAIVHSACDVAVVSLLPGMTGASVPSRLYNILAAGRPVIAIADPSSELARVVDEERVGWIVEPGNVESLVSTVRFARQHPEQLHEMSIRARHAAERTYSMDSFIRSYRALLT